MQSLATFFEDNKYLALAAIAAAIAVLVIVVLVAFRLLFGRRLRAAANGRARQPRLGIVDAYDLDRQRQLVLVRRDNVEHLIMIGGPTDVVIESAIVRNATAPLARDVKENAASPLAGILAQPPVSANAPAALPPAAPSLPLPPRAAPGRTEPTMTARTEPAMAARTEPAMGTPAPERGSAERPTNGNDRPTPRPIAIPDPAAPPKTIDLASSAVADGESTARPGTRPTAAASPSAVSPLPSAAPSPSTVQSGSAAASNPPPSGTGEPLRPPQRAPLPTRPVTPRPPLPPRPSLAASLPPRQPRPPLGERVMPSARPDPAAPEPFAPVAPSPGPGPAAEVDAPPPARPTDAPAPARPTNAPRSIESLESLEEEMAKLLGRPTAPRRDG